MKALQNLGAIVHGICLFDKQVVCTRDNWAVGIRARNGRRRRQTVEGEQSNRLRGITMSGE